MRYAPELAEGVGTFFLVFAGCGAIMVGAVFDEPGHGGIAATFGLVIAAMIYATGHISGAHFNPAVTAAFAATGHFPWRRVGPYWLAQSTGAVLAALALRAILGDVADLGSTTPDGSLSVAGIAATEFLITLLLMFVISSVATDGRAIAPMAGVAIGATVALAALFAGPLTGASMNPARTLGPALVSGTWDAILVYLVATLAGAVVGAWLYDLIRRGAKPTGRRA